MLIVLLCLCLPTSNALYSLYPSEFYHVIYGKFWEFDDLFLPMDDENETVSAPAHSNATINDVNLRQLLRDAYVISNEKVADEFRIPVEGSDAKEFNDLNFQIYNFTRKRTYDYWKGYKDPYDPSSMTEVKKKKMLEKIGLTFLIHSRYKIKGALEQRLKIRSDKRYRLGYLFHRLRRLKTEMLKLVSNIKEQYKVWWYKQSISVVKGYEQVVRFDVDIRDTIDYIKEIYEIPAPYDIMKESDEGLAQQKGQP